MGRALRKVYTETYRFAPTTAQLATVGPTTFNMFQVPAGWRVLYVDCYVTTLFTAGSPAMTVGDGDDDDGFMDAGDITEGTAGIYAGKAAFFNAQPGKLYTVADTVDLFYTGDALTTGGAATFVMHYHKVF